MTNSCPVDSFEKNLTICFKSKEDYAKKIQKIIDCLKQSKIKKNDKNKTNKVAKKKSPKKISLKARVNCDLERQEECYQKNKECNPKTNRCVNKKTTNVVKKKTQKVAKKKSPKNVSLKARVNCDLERQRECKEYNKFCNPQTNRCVNKKPINVVKKKTQKVAKKKAPKTVSLKARMNCDLERQKECYQKNKECNLETNRCVNKKTKKKERKIKIKKPENETKSIPLQDDVVFKRHTELLDKVVPQQIEEKTPQYNKDLRNGDNDINLINKYSPSINRNLKSLKTLSPTGAQGCDVETDIWDEKKGKCFGWKSKKAKDIMLRNLVSKKPIDCNAVTAPKQMLSNCWFNSFFVVFFISDKGRKFNRWLREAMITGVMADGRKVPSKIRKPLFLLNKYIDASLHPKYDKTDFATLMDTNDIIEDVHRAISKSVNKDKTLIAKVDVPSNPISFYRGVYEYLGGDLMHWNKISVHSPDNDIEWLKTVILNFATMKDGTPSHPYMTKVLFLEIFDNESDKFNKPTEFTINTVINKNNVKYKYVLDSIVLRDTKKAHFSSYLTCNNTDFLFDGESFSRMSEFDWKSKINKDVEWKTSEYDTRFNFQKGYQILIYYLDEVSKIN